MWSPYRARGKWRLHSTGFDWQGLSFDSISRGRCDCAQHCRLHLQPHLEPETLKFHCTAATAEPQCFVFCKMWRLQILLFPHTNIAYLDRYSFSALPQPHLPKFFFKFNLLGSITQFLSICLHFWPYTVYHMIGKSQEKAVWALTGFPGCLLQLLPWWYWISYSSAVEAMDTVRSLRRLLRLPGWEWANFSPLEQTVWSSVP
jgi:hypothetical protein